MAITTYAELQTAIAAWLTRAGDTLVTTPAPDFITLCEARLNYGSGEPGHPLYTPPLRVRQMQERVTASAGSEYLAVPTDYLEVVDFKINTNPETHLTYSTPAQFAEAASSQSAGTPKTYTIIGGEFRFGPVPSSNTAELWYYQSIPALADGVNWLLTAAPNVYLFGAVLEAADYLDDDAKSAKYHAKFQAAVMGLQSQDRRAKYGSTPLVMRPVTATP